MLSACSPPKAWIITTLAAAIGLLVIGLPTAIYDNPFFVRMTPVRPQDYVIVIAHSAPSEEIRRVGSIMREIQSRVLACDKEYRQELEAGLNSLKGTTAYDHVVRIIKSTLPPCPAQR